jgi:transcriptional regulator with XRE-family HTH domain
VIAGEVRRYRQERHMSGQQLADRCAELGMPIARAVLANLESGRRDSVSMAEILVLARALRVPPVLLVFPLGREETMEVLPDQWVTPWDALRWFSGERWRGIFSGELASVLGVPERQEIELFRDHEFAVDQWSDNLRDLNHALESAQSADTEPLRNVFTRRADSLTEQLQEDERHIRETRERLRAKNLIPPPLPRALAHLEEA